MKCNKEGRLNKNCAHLAHLKFTYGMEMFSSLALESGPFEKSNWIGQQFKFQSFPVRNKGLHLTSSEGLIGSG